MSIDVASTAAIIGLTPRTCIEVGAAHPFSYRLEAFARAGSRVVLVEANPRLYYCLTQGWDQGDFQSTWPSTPARPHSHPGLPEQYPNIKVVHGAVTDQRGGTVRFFECNASSFVAGIECPEKVNGGFVERDSHLSYEVPSVTIDQLDDGQVDILLSDTEGCEWYCIKNLVSRPRIIVLETHGQRYQNPFRAEIDEWMRAGGYTLRQTDGTDTMWIREGV